MKLFFSMLIFAVVAKGQDCDCPGYAACIKQAKASKAGHEEKMQCVETCKSNLDATLRAAMEACKPKAKDHSKFECILEKSCTTKTGDKSSGSHVGKQRKHEKCDGKHGLYDGLSEFLSEAQKTSMEAFKSCVKTNCKRDDSTSAGSRKNGCKAQFPNCGVNRSNFQTAAAECGFQKAEGKFGMCQCLTQQLGITDPAACERRARGGKHGKRNERSADLEEFGDLFD